MPLTKSFGFSIQLTGPAKRDIAAISKWTLREFGEAAALRYRELIRQAFRDIQADPERPDSKFRPDLLIDGARTYHLTSSRKRVAGQGVKDPRHFLLYRIKGNVIELARILHDSRDLERHLPKDYRRLL